MTWYIIGFLLLIILILGLYVICDDMIEVKHNYQKNSLELELIEKYGIIPKSQKEVDVETEK